MQGMFLSVLSIFLSSCVPFKKQKKQKKRIKPNLTQSRWDRSDSRELVIENGRSALYNWIKLILLILFRENQKKKRWIVEQMESGSAIAASDTSGGAIALF